MAVLNNRSNLLKMAQRYRAAAVEKFALSFLAANELCPETAAHCCSMGLTYLTTAAVAESHAAERRLSD